MADSLSLHCAPGVIAWQSIEMEHAVGTITRAINFIRVRDLNHRQFKTFLEESHSQQQHGDLRYHAGALAQPRKGPEKMFSLCDENCQFM